MCDNEKFIAVPCAQGLHFDAKNKICNFPQNAKCQPGQGQYPDQGQSQGQNQQNQWWTTESSVGGIVDV